ncbi:hypothetical protein SLEP1_g9122 [Rubroshorea leprosula]|uniref:S-protein homolog n=1 Tax=Rubroshorea leprosula TaxID=152421 RepID=A0AAV5I9K4_9ROSI|nr:hypothetical protein SLEP1_g9122 [Rubroshorea leprosula]
MATKNMITFFFAILFLWSFVTPSAARNPPAFAEKVMHFFFPNITVALRNDCERDVFYSCKFKDSEGHLTALQPNGTKSWTFKEILFPLRWCYVSTGKNVYGVFWTYSVRLKCTYCNFSLRKDGVYLYIKDKREWEKRPLYLDPLS